MTRFLRRAALGSTLFATIALAACSDQGRPAAAEEAVEHEEEGEELSGQSGRVELGEAAFRNAGIEVAEVRLREVAGSVSRAVVPGQVELDPARVVLVSPRTSGRIERLTVVEGDRVQAGQPLAHVLSPAFLTAQNDFIQALRRAKLLAGTGDEDGARALAEAARRRLKLIGASDRVVERLIAGGDPLDLLPVASPMGGSVIEAHTLAGAAVDAGSPIFTVADLAVVNVVADVPERALPALRQGQSAEIRLSAYPDMRFGGVVERIRNQLDPSTRTAKAVIRVENPRGTLRPGMFGSVALAPAEGTPLEARPVVPAGAVVTDGAEAFVFVEVAPRTFERRAVDVEPLGEGELVVRSGLAAGERVVTRGAFTLKSELGKAEFGEDDH